jgi:hypothetical protein
MAPVAKKTVESIKLGQFVTAKGSALFVSAPNASQYDDSKQEASIMLKAEDWEALKAKIDAKIVEMNGYALVPAAKMKYPIKEATDQDGNETGDIILKAKTGIQYPAKILDAQGKVIKTDATFHINNRSIIRLAVGVEVIKSGMYNGVICRLNAIKILSAQSYDSNAAFGDDEGDYYADEPQQTSAEDTTDWAD